MDAKLEGFERILKGAARFFTPQESCRPGREAMGIHQVGMRVHAKTIGLTIDLRLTYQVRTQPVA